MSDTPDNPLSATDFFNRRFDHQQAGRLSDAIADYTEAIRLDPQHEQAYLNRARMYAFQKSFERALQDVQAVLQFNPHRQKHIMTKA